MGRLAELLGGARLETTAIARAAQGARAARAHLTSAARTPSLPAPDQARLWEGTGDHARLRTEYRRRTPMFATIADFAAHGRAPRDQRWRARDGRLDRSAARQAVLTAAALHGMSYTDIANHHPTAGGSWKGLARAYARSG
ncbi:hypothetical protein ACFYV7_39490 [Nocardia suismassiliense]|uniref:Uncharacterized protein n=1 Tax=Nocardia suismassiliense TaxID=2077092 RepID=A0ABW6R5X9_9NOCA